MLRAVIHHAVAVARDLDDDLVADAGVDGRTVRISDGVLNARLGEVLIHAFLTVAVNGSERCIIVGVQRLFRVYLCLGVLAIYIAVAVQVELAVSSGRGLGLGKLERVAQLNGSEVGNRFAKCPGKEFLFYIVIHFETIALFQFVLIDRIGFCIQQCVSIKVVSKVIHGKVPVFHVC